MRLTFDRIIVENFKTYMGRHELPVAMYGEGLHFIRGVNAYRPRLGANGTGKSTLLSDAILWCLFGETADGLKNPDVRPWRMKNGRTRVTVYITRGKSAHRITRTISPNRIMIDGKDAGQGDIVQLIGMGIKLMTNTIILPQGQKLFFDLAPREQLQLFADALDLDRWYIRSQVATSRVVDLDRRISELVGEAIGIGAAMTQLARHIEQEEAKAEEWEKVWRGRRQRQERELKGLQREFDKAEDSRGRHDLAYEGAEVELRHLARQFEKAGERMTDATRQLAVANDRVAALATQLQDVRKRLKEMGDNDRCDKCGQPLKGTALERHRDDARKTIADLRKAIDRGAPTKVQQEFDDAQSHLANVRRQVLEFRKKSEQAKDDLDAATKRTAELKAAIDGIKSSLAEKEDETNPHRMTLRDLKKRQKQLAADLKDCADEKTSVEAKHERAKFWVRGFKDIRLFVLHEVMQEFELNTNAMLDEAGLVGWNVRYQLERETARGTTSHALQTLVQSPDSKEHVKWESWSGGEAQRLRIVGALALSETLLNHAGIETSMEVLDEPTQHLSPEGVADLCEYLADRANRLRRSVFYIDHASIESTRFSSVTTTRRDAGGSNIDIPAF